MSKVNFPVKVSLDIEVAGPCRIFFFRSEKDGQIHLGIEADPKVAVLRSNAKKRVA